MTSSLVTALWSLVYVAALAPPEELAERARFAEGDLDYDRAADLWLEVIGNPETSDTLRFEANLSAGAIERIRGNDTEARFHFQYVLRQDPEFRLPDDTPPKVRNFFELVRQEVKAEIARSSVVTPERPTVTAPSGVAQSSAGTAPIAKAPAQTSLDDDGIPVLPLSLFSVGGAALAFAVGGVAVGSIFGWLAWDQYNAALASNVQVERLSSYEAAQTNALVANVGYAAALVCAVGAVGIASAGGVLWALE
jgi:hypothetical protein